MVLLAKPVMAMLLLYRTSKQLQVMMEKNWILLYWGPLIITIFFQVALPKRLP